MMLMCFRSAKEFDANLSDLANFESGSYRNEFHRAFTDQNLRAVAQDDRTALMNTIKLYSDAGHTNPDSINDSWNQWS